MQRSEAALKSRMLARCSTQPDGIDGVSFLEK